MRRCIASSCLAVTLLVVSFGSVRDVYAADPTRDPEGARAHFDAGKRLRDEGDCRGAIPEFDKSLAADKSIGAFYNLGFCHEQLGHKQEAYEAYKKAQELASAKKDDRLKEIGGAITSLLDTPHIRLLLPQPIPPGLTIKVDDQVLPEAFHQNETTIFTKSNKYHFVVITAPGYDEFRENVETKQVKAIELKKPQSKGGAGGAGGNGGNTTPAKERWAVWHYAGVGIVGAGVVALGVGGYFGIVYLGDRSDLDDRINSFGCGADAVCDEKEVKDPTERNKRNDSATKKALIDENNQLEKNVKVQVAAPAIIGGVLIVGGLVMFLIAPYDTEPASKAEARPRALKPRAQFVPHLDPRNPGFSVMGTF